MRTLNPARHRIVLSGTFTAYGPANDGYSATVYGPSTGAFTIINTATITNAAPGPYAAGLLLAAPGTLNNIGTISAPNGEAILLESPSAGSQITNRGRATGAIAAIQLNGPGTVRNAGYLQSSGVGIAFAQSGYALNTGYIGGNAGISGGNVTINNAGLINAGEDAITLIQGTVQNTGTLQAGRYAIRAMAGTITNQGTIIAGATAIIDAIHASITNSGQITGSTGIEVSGTLQNAPTGTITATQSFGIDLLAGGYLNNQGLITAPTAAILLAAGGTINNAGTLRSAPNGDGILATAGPTTITNTGTIYAWQTGIAVTGPATITNAGSIAGAAGIKISGGPADIQNTGIISGIATAGIALTGPAYLNNQGTITGTKTALNLAGGGTIINAGTLSGASAIFDITNTITLTNRGAIFGAAYGITAAAGATIANYGTILAHQGITLGAANNLLTNAGLITATGGDALSATAGATVTNTGLITATQYALAFGATATIQNTGTIAGQAGALKLQTGGTLANTGQLQGAFGLYAGGPTTLTNAGTISGAITDGADLFGPATLTNTGLITGADYGILATAGATITNTGTISGGAYALQLNAYYANRLIIAPGSTIIGAVDGGAGILEFAAAPTTGTFTASENTQFADFSSLEIDPGATWDFTKSFTLTSGFPILNNGTIRESTADTLTINAPLIGTGKITLSKHALTLNAATAATQKIQFSGTNETLALGDAPHFNAKLESFAPGDTIDLTTIPLQNITATHFAAGTLTLSEAHTTLLFTFTNPSTFAHETFALTALGPGTALTLSPPAALLAHNLHTNPHQFHFICVRNS